MITKDELIKQARKLKINLWPLSSCSKCDYPCGFVFNLPHEDVIYDTGCYCDCHRHQRKSNWAEVTITFNSQAGEAKKRHSKYWGFK